MPTDAPLEHDAHRTLRTLKTQPTFAIELPIPAGEAVARLRRALTSPELEGKADAAGACIDFKIDRADRRFWSPHLSVMVSDHAGEDGTPGAQVFGRFLPRPEVWTAFAAMYFVAAFAALAGGVYGYVQWVLEAPPTALLLIPIGAVVIAGLYAASLFGQSLSRDQIGVLQARVDRALHLAFDDVVGGNAPASGE